MSLQVDLRGRRAIVTGGGRGIGLTETAINRRDLADPAFREMRLGRIPLNTRV
jgi:hypothetical protein